MNLFKTMKNKPTISTETCDSTSLQECLRRIPLPFCQDHSLGILFLTVIIIRIIGLFLLKWCMKTRVFLQPLLFFSQTGKIRRSKCSSMSSRLWFLMASGRRWLAIPPACCRGGEGRERLSGRATLYIRERRSEHKKRLLPTSTARATSRALGQL